MAGRPRGAKPPHHGTRARYIRHLRAREVPCDACTAANTEYTRRRRRVLRHTSDTDLWPIIHVLYEALTGSSGRERAA